MSKLDSTLTITLGDELYELEPTIKAAKRISAHFGGYTQALARIQSLDLDALTVVVRYGIGADDELAKKLDGLVWRAKPIALLPVLVEYIMLLCNGGQPRKEDDEEPGKRKAAGAA